MVVGWGVFHPSVCGGIQPGKRAVCSISACENCMCSNGGAAHRAGVPPGLRIPAAAGRFPLGALPTGPGVRAGLIPGPVPRSPGVRILICTHRALLAHPRSIITIPNAEFRNLRSPFWSSACPPAIARGIRRSLGVSAMCTRQNAVARHRGCQSPDTGDLRVVF